MQQLAEFFLRLRLADWLLWSTVLILFLVVILLVILVKRRSPEDLVDSLALQGELLERGQVRLEQTVREEIARNRGEASASARQHREELGQSMKGFNDSVLKGMTDMGRLLKEQMESFSLQIQQVMAVNVQQQETLRQVVATRLQQIQEDNTKRLEQMRATVDEKLQGTLEKRLGESFKHVSERLEQVHKGLGEMQNLATGVGDLKRVLTNVKSRGGWGEIQLAALLEHLLAPEQFARNVRIGEISGEVVEFALRLPGRGEGEEVWLPIDAKFPLEDYERLVDAQEKADPKLWKSPPKTSPNASERRPKPSARNMWCRPKPRILPSCSFPTRVCMPKSSADPVWWKPSSGTTV